MTEAIINQLIQLNPDASIKDLIDFVSMEKELREFELKEAKIKQTAQEFEVLNLRKNDRTVTHRLHGIHGHPA